MSSILAKTVADHHKDWDVRLPYAMAVYRATRHDTIGYSPNFLVLHHEIRVFVDLMHEAACENLADDHDDFVQRKYVNELPLLTLRFDSNFVAVLNETSDTMTLV